MTTLRACPSKVDDVGTKKSTFCPDCDHVADAGGSFFIPESLPFCATAVYFCCTRAKEHINWHICVRAARPSVRARCGAGAGCSAIKYQSLSEPLQTPNPNARGQVADVEMDAPARHVTTAAIERRTRYPTPGDCHLLLPTRPDVMSAPSLRLCQIRTYRVWWGLRVVHCPANSAHIRQSRHQWPRHVTTAAIERRARYLIFVY